MELVIVLSNVATLIAKTLAQHQLLLTISPKPDRYTSLISLSRAGLSHYFLLSSCVLNVRLREK
jgi:hypothetical protein